METDELILYLSGVAERLKALVGDCDDTTLSPQLLSLRESIQGLEAEISDDLREWEHAKAKSKTPKDLPGQTHFPFTRGTAEGARGDRGAGPPSPSRSPTGQKIAPSLV